MHRITCSCRLLAAVPLALLLAACGGGDTGAPETPPVVVVSAPTASFASAAGATANGALAFDASASTSADGSTLQYVWDFGDGQRGGGKTIAHVFASAGAATVTLTVVDGAARQASATRTVTIAPGPVASGNVTAHALVKDLDGLAVVGVSIGLTGPGAASVTTDATGRADIALGVAVPLALKLSKTGYADQLLAVQLPAGAGADTLIEATMRPRDAAVPLTDAHLGGTVTGRAGASVTLPADALVDGGGALATGAVQVALTPVDVTLPGAGGFPGRFDGVRQDGATTPIVSFGTVEFMLSAGARRLQLAPGKTATIEIPIWAAMRLDGSVLAVGDTTPLWSLDEASSIWVQEGTGQVVASTASPSGLALRATISHFSWWNSDIGFDPYGPRPRCVYDTDSGVPGGLDTFATATICNMLADMDRGLSGTAATPRESALAARQATPLPPRIAGYSRRAVLPIAGGVTIPVPAGLGVALNATALNGTWSGRRVVNGPVGVQEEVLVKMRPIAGSGPAVEAIVPPFDTTRALQTVETARFSFNAAASQFVRITASQADGSSLSGRVRLLQGSTALASKDFGVAPGVLVFGLPAGGGYGIELSGLANTPGAYRLQVELLGGLQTENVAYPLDIDKSLPAFTAYRATFDVAAAGAAHFAWKPAGTGVTLRLLGPDGAVLLARTSNSSPFGTAEIIDLSLPAPGRYTSEVQSQDGSAIQFRLTGEPTSWLALGPLLDADAGFSMIDLVADRNGKPVVGYERTIVTGTVSRTMLLLRRWNGVAWETVGSDITFDLPCGGHDARFAFDSGNAPIVVYGNKNNAATNKSVTTALRFSAGAWQPLGPDGGALPNPGDFGSACASPSLAIDSSDRPVVAHQSNNEVWVHRLENNAWVGLAAAAGDSFPALSGAVVGFDLKLDAGELPWLVVKNGGITSVSRFDAIARAWQPAGPNAGRLPEPVGFGISSPKLRFDAAGKPVVAGIAPVGTSASFSTGVAVYRFDGTTWLTTGGFELANSSLGNTPEIGFTLAGDEALLAWQNQVSGGASAMVVQRNTTAGYAPVGSGLGEVTQYWPHGITPDTFSLDPRLLVIGSEVYLAFNINSSGAPGSPWKVVLLKKVGG